MHAHVIPVIAVAVAAMHGVPAAAAGAPSYPDKPLRLIVPFPPGGGNDILARTVGNGLSDVTGQPVIVDNRGGAGGLVGAESAARAAADGYTIFLASVGNLAFNPALYAKLPYDPVRDFAPVTLLATSVFLMAVHPAVPAKSVQELIILAKAKPGTLNYASAGAGSSLHLTGEIFKLATGTDLVHIAYKGSAPALTDLIGGRVQMTIDDAPTLLPHVKSGKLRALAIATAEPSPLYPDLPTVSASGVPGYVSAAMQGMFAPAKTPDAIIRRLNQETVRVLSRADVKEKFVGVGAEVIPSTPEQLGAWVKAERERLGKVIKETGIKVE